MADDKIKQQRDRFLAFSFASADLFMEIGEGGEILHTFGAARSLTGSDEKSILGHSWLELFAQEDRATVSGMRARAKEGHRCGPYLVKLAEKIAHGGQAVITGIKMPGSDKFYVTVGLTNVAIAKYAQAVRDGDEHALLDKSSFLKAASEAMGLARSLGQDVGMTLLDITNPQDVKKRLGPEQWEKFSASITHLLNTKSLDGQAAAEIKDGRYSLIHDNNLDSDLLKDDILRLSRESDPEGHGFEIESKTVSADLSTLSERDTAKALIYTINEFERKGTSLTIENLNSGFKTYLSANAHKIVEFKSIVERLNFDLYFQPIVDLETSEAVHYEMLSRFKDRGSTQEWIIFGEDIGMAADFDFAVCERAINYLIYKAPGRQTKFAVNLSGQSIQNEQFFKTLYAKLSLHKNLSERLIFEITESTMIEDLDMVNGFIKILQNDGYKVCLDDFGAGSASFQYLHHLHVDYVKIDGEYTKKLLSSERDAIMVKNLSQMCRDLNIRVIAEMVEQAEQADRVRSLGIGYAQGYFFGKAEATPDYSARKHLSTLST